jgi:hypothetical protein
VFPWYEPYITIITDNLAKRVFKCVLATTITGARYPGRLCMDHELNARVGDSHYNTDTQHPGYGL